MLTRSRLHMAISVPSATTVTNVPWLFPDHVFNCGGRVLRRYVPLADAYTCGRDPGHESAETAADAMTTALAASAATRHFMTSYPGPYHSTSRRPVVSATATRREVARARAPLTAAHRIRAGRNPPPSCDRGTTRGERNSPAH